MNKLNVLTVMLLVVGFMSFNAAQAKGPHNYIGIGAGKADTSIDGLDENADLDVLSIQLGVWMTDNSSAEIRMGTGIGDDSAGPVDVAIENLGGLYAAYHWRLGNHLSVYGIAGGTRASIKLSRNSDSDQESENSLSYGAGMDISIVRIEYMRYLDTSDVEADVLSVGLRYKFD